MFLFPRPHKSPTSEQEIYFLQPLVNIPTYSANDRTPHPSYPNLRHDIVPYGPILSSGVFGHNDFPGETSSMRSPTLPAESLAYTHCTVKASPMPDGEFGTYILGRGSFDSSEISHDANINPLCPPPPAILGNRSCHRDGTEDQRICRHVLDT
jgi:hypothetical protein